MFDLCPVCFATISEGYQLLHLQWHKRRDDHERSCLALQGEDLMCSCAMWNVSVY